MRLIYQHDPATPITQVFLVVPRSGACLDPEPLQGLSRFALRLMFMGAGGMDHAELSGQLERLGAATGFSLFNDHVTLRLTTLTANLDAALDLFLTSLLQPNFDPGEFAQLKAELTSAWVADREESKQLRAQEVYLQRIYRGRPHAYRADGLESGLRAARLDDLHTQYRRLLSEREAFCAVLSDLPQAEAETRIMERLALPAADGPSAAGTPFPWDGFAPPRRGAGHRVTIVTDGQTSTDEVLLGSFAVAQTVPDWHLHRLIGYTFGGDMNSRLFRIVRGERGLSYGASCWYESAGGRGPRNARAPFTMYTFPSIEHTAEAVPLVVRLYRELVEQGVTEAELELARSALINSYPFKRDTPQKLLTLEVEEALYGLVTDDVEANRRKLLAATPEAVRGALQRTHHPDRLEIVLLGDPARLRPIAEALPGVEKIETIRYPDKGE
ncbi:MAG TPA: pitrilysin family protein [bacterium]|nr:pitrilysin family protein [bacterium]